MKGQHDYNETCNCYRCKGIRGNPHFRKPKLKPVRRFRERHASREEQHARYLDCGPQNWDDR